MKARDGVRVSTRGVEAADAGCDAVATVLTVFSCEECANYLGNEGHVFTQTQNALTRIAYEREF